MDSTISVSKGCFVFKNGTTKTENRSKKTKKNPKNYVPILGDDMINQLFYKTYNQTWRQIKTEIDKIQEEIQSRILDDLVKYVETSYARNDDKILPTAALLTGINQPDHLQQFETIAEKIEEKISARVSIIQSRNCSNLKSAVETMVHGFIEETNRDDDDDDDEDCDHKTLRRSQYTMQVLSAWYENNFPKKDLTLVVILPDFECFSADILQDFILIISSFSKGIPIVVILGLATAIGTLHSTLPYHVTSKIRLRIFQTQSAPVQLNEYCLMEHFFQGNAFALCQNFKESLEIVKNLTHEDIETIRRLPSFRPYVESMRNCQKIILILTEDQYFKKKLPKLLLSCHKYFLQFRSFIEFLWILVDDLPKSPFGGQIRELYSTCISSNLTELNEFKESWQILSFLSKDEFISKISRAILTTEDFLQNNFPTDVTDLDWITEIKIVNSKRILFLD